MNVVLLNDSFPPLIDGVATAVTNYASILTESGRAKVMVGTPRYPGVDYSTYPYEVVAYSSLDTPSVAAGYRAGMPINFKALSRLSKFEPNIIHVHCPAASAVLGRILREETDAPLIFTYHTKFDLDIARAIKSEHIQKEVIKAMVSNIEACDEVWTVSHGAGDNLRSLGYEGDIRVVSNGVDFAKGRVEESLVQEVVKDFDLPAGVPMFLFVGRIINYKGLPLILDAMRMLSARGIDYRMVFVGSGVNAKDLQKTTLEYGIPLDVREKDGTITSTSGTASGKVIFTGPIYDRDVLRAWNTRADLFLFPSTYDTNGIVVREAAACGLASVLIRDSCAAEGITHGRNGFIIDETPEAMAALLSELAGNPDKMHQVGQCAMDEIYISWEDSVFAAADRYQEVLELQAAGKLKPRRQGKSDKLLSFTADVMDGMYDTFHFPKALFRSTRDSVQVGLGNIRDGFRDVRSEAQTGFRGVREDMMDNIKSFTNEMRDNVNEFKEDVQVSYHGIKDDVKGSFSEIRDIMLDNLEGMRENFSEAGAFLLSKGKEFTDEFKDLKKEMDDEWNKLNGTKN
ncbi:MAG: glycosyltransferase [Oscillospiraceae bacterium]|nr:glycosyltransferase [Oscillospiraceae bacterium]